MNNIHRKCSVRIDMTEIIDDDPNDHCLMRSMVEQELIEKADGSTPEMVGQTLAIALRKSCECLSIKALAHAIIYLLDDGEGDLASIYCESQEGIAQIKKAADVFLSKGNEDNKTGEAVE